MKLYRINRWSELFETAETRKLKALGWVPTPNKHDGLTFRRLVAQRDRSDLFAAWNLILQIASKGPPERRGTLAREGTPLTAEDLALMTGFPAAIFQRAFEFFSHSHCGWLSSEEFREISPSPADPTGNGGSSPGTPADSPEPPADAPAIAGSSPVERREGMEGTRMECKVAGAPAVPAGRLKKPSREELLAKAAFIGLPESEVDRFLNHYESNGWKVGKNPMRSWPHSLGNWKATWEERARGQGNTGKGAANAAANTRNSNIAGFDDEERLRQERIRQEAENPPKFSPF